MNTTTGCKSSTRVAVEALVIPLIMPVKVKQEAIRKSDVTAISQVESLLPLEKTTAIQYIDGLSRIQQEIVQQASPAGFDVVQPFEYDNNGRVAKSYLPYVAQTTNGAIHPAYVIEQMNFYNNPSDKIADDSNPYSVNIFENSPQGRILNQGGFGSAWQPASNHTKRFQYTFNVANEVRKFDTEGSSTSFYEPNKILKTIVTDENGNDDIIFHDLNGRTLLKKERLDEQIDGVNVPYLETYYIYDDLDRIKYVISPKGIDALQDNGWSFPAVLDQYVYQFIYDQRGRVVEKKVPGQAWMYYVYDKLNRLVLVQDGHLRGTNRWMFLKYDMKGRAVMQGLYSNSVQSSRLAMQTLVDGLYIDSNTTYPSGAYFEIRGTSLEGYSNRSFPKTNADNTALQVLNVNYFDSYDFDFNGTDDYSYAVQSLTYEHAPIDPLNYATGSKRLILGTTTWLYNYIFYDKYRRIIQVRSNNQLNTAVNNIVTNVYDFEGKILQRKQHHIAGPGGETIIMQIPEYDRKGRLLSIDQQTEAGEIITWTNKTRVEGDGFLLKKLSNAQTTWNAGAFSVEKIEANEDGWMEFAVGETNRDKVMGLSEVDSGPDNVSIDYALFTKIDGTLHVLENGASRGQVGTFNVSDILRIERKNGTIYYKKNNVTLYTSLIPSTTELHVDCSFFAATGSFKNVNLKRKREVTVAKYEYNELGQIVDKKLHNTSQTDFIQSVDFRYNIRGWLESINNAQLNVNSVNNDDLNDYFGMEFLYNTIQSGLNNTANYSGNISVIKWKGQGTAPGADDQESYKYHYDRSGRFESATSQVYKETAWTKDIGVYNESMSYDHNGNIVNLQRTRRKHQLNGVEPSYGAEIMDNLLYTYNSTGAWDQLLKVEDASANERGFKNGANLETEYTYDANGNVLVDENKGISGITYNFLGKPTAINFTDGRKVEYTYDAAGAKLTMKNYQGTSLLLTTQYVDGFVYENNALRFFGSPEGRVVKNSTGKLEYQYVITDHQGNVRVLFSAETPTPQRTETNFESPSNTHFQNYPTGANRSSLELFDHTDATTTATYSQLLNGGHNSQVGISKSLKVYPGDKVKVEAYAKYWNLTENSSNLIGFATALTSAFGLSATSTGEALKAYNGLNTFGGWVAAGTAHESNPGHPKGFVTILLFDKDHNFLDAAWDQLDYSYEQVGISPKAAFDYLVKEVTVKQEGYAYIYLSNESATFVDIFFDDVALTHTKSNIIQYNEYYPFGLTRETSWTREGNSNDALFNGGSKLNEVTERYETFFRDYDPALGRFMQIDPYAVLYHGVSPYQFAQNNPVLFNDPTGALVHKTLPCSCKDGSIGADFGDRERFYSGGYHPNYWTDGIYYDDWVLDEGSATYENGLASGLTDIGGRLYYVNDDGSYGEYEEVNGEWGYYVDSDGPIDNSSVSFNYLNGELVRTLATLEEVSRFVSVDAQQGGSWIKDHFFAEFKADVSFGPQGTASFMPGEGVMPAPYSNSNEIGSLNLKIMALTLLGFKANNRDGFRKITMNDKNINQGIGIAFMGTAAEINREFLNGKIKEETAKFSLAHGLLGIEYNFTSGELFIGSMPNASWTLGFGIGASMKAGFTF